MANRRTKTVVGKRAPAKPATPAKPSGSAPVDPDKAPVAEIGGRKGPDPTRYGDWEKDGRCVDF